MPLDVVVGNQDGSQEQLVPRVPSSSDRSNHPGKRKGWDSTRPREEPVLSWNHVPFGHDTSHAQEGAMRAGVTYDPNGSLFSVMFRWKGTMLPMALQKPMFWMMVTINIALLGYHNYLLSIGEEGLPELAWEAAVVRAAARSTHTRHPPRLWLCVRSGADVAAHLLHCLLWATVLHTLL